MIGRKPHGPTSVESVTTEVLQNVFKNRRVVVALLVTSDASQSDIPYRRDEDFHPLTPVSSAVRFADGVQAVAWGFEERPSSMVRDVAELFPDHSPKWVEAER